MKGAGAGLSMIPTPYTQIAGAVLSTVGSLWGNTGSVNEHTGEINKASGFSKWLGLGPSTSKLEAKSNRVKNSIVDKDITEHLRAEYYMDPNNSANNNIFYAAEGGIAPNLTPAYLDSREVVVSPDRGSAVRLPYAEGTDTIPAMVMPYSGVLSEDIEYKKGISFADLGDKIDKSFPDNTRAKQLLMQKALNAQEMKKVSKKTKNGIPAYEKGIYYVDGQRAEYRHGRWWWNEGGKKDAQGKMYFVPYTGKSTPSETKPIKHTSETPVGILDPAYRQHVRYSSINDVARKDTVSKPSSGKKTAMPQATASAAPQEEKLTPEQIAESLRIADIGERHWLRGNVTEPKQSFASLASSTPTILKTQKLAPVTPASNTANSTATSNASSLDFDMLDYLNLAGPLANMFAPDAEAVRAHTISPVYGPTSYDVTPEMRQIASNRATANYDANQVNHNTGANMTFKAMTQLNSDKAAAAALSNKANIQNQLAFQNANIANSAMQFNANASHTAEVESAQNRAAARNIRRKGFGDFFTNIGKIRQDKRLSARDAALYKLLRGDHDNGLLSYGMQDAALIGFDKLFNYGA